MAIDDHRDHGDETRAEDTFEGPVLAAALRVRADLAPRAFEAALDKSLGQVRASLMHAYTGQR